jgi:hypothetical protein
MKPADQPKNAQTGLPTFELRSGLVGNFGHYSSRYDDPYDQTLEKLAPEIEDRGRITVDELSTIYRWKSPRSVHHAAANDPLYVEEVTRTALTTASERLRVEALMLLRGCSWPMASVILHWFHKERYPILDFRALWSLGVDATIVRYGFEFWQAYVAACRRLADVHGLSMRELDRALWQYSKEHQAND